MKVAVVDRNGKSTGKKVELPDSIFGIEPNEHAIYLDVKHYLANQRQGTHKAKERGEIKGSTRKIKRQKGTGTARAGSIKNPLFRGGGRVFGPRPRNYGFKINKKVKRLARKSALSLAAGKDRIMVVEAFEMEAPKTKDFVKIMESLNLKDKKTLWVLSESNKNVYLSSRNLQKVNIITSSKLNTYSIMNANKIVFFDTAIEGIVAILDA
jgi:large subunit ribosomal protein L4